MRCSFCGEPVIRATGEIHHRTKRSRGGQDSAGNLVRICTRCHTLVHVCEGLSKKGIPRADVESQLRVYLSKLSGIDVDGAVTALAEAGEQAATARSDAGRKVVPVTVKVPADLLERVCAVASDRHVTRNSLILWALSEMVEGRVILPQG